MAEFRQQTRRQIHLIAEANIYDPALLPPRPGRPAYDAIWCDDIMHAIYAAIAPGVHVTHREYTGPADLAESLQHGFLYEGMPQRRMNDDLRSRLPSEPVNAFRSDFVIALQNHDNVGNHPHGLRVHQLTSPAHQKAAAALILLYPAIPFLFMGEEHAESAPFRFFADFEDQHLRRAVDEGRANEYPHHEWAGAVSPTEERAFQESKLAGSDDPSMFAWYQSLLMLRSEWLRHGAVESRKISTTIWEPQTHLFGLNYAAEVGFHWFVLSRLTPINESPSPIRVQVNGELLLDSAQARLAGFCKPIEIRPAPHAHRPWHVSGTAEDLTHSRF